MDLNFATCRECMETTKITHTMPYRLFIMRRRQCQSCKKRIVTFEVSQGMLERIPELREFLRKSSTSAPEKRVDQAMHVIPSTNEMTASEPPILQVEAKPKDDLTSEELNDLMRGLLPKPK